MGSLEIYQQKRPEATWGLLVDLHQLGALLFHHPGLQRCMHYPKQLSEGRFQVIAKLVSYLPVTGITSFLLSCLCTHQPGSLSHAIAPPPSK